MYNINDKFYSGMITVMEKSKIQKIGGFGELYLRQEMISLSKGLQELLIGLYHSNTSKEAHFLRG